MTTQPHQSFPTYAVADQRDAILAMLVPPPDPTTLPRHIPRPSPGRGRVRRPRLWFRAAAGADDAGCIVGEHRGAEVLT